MTVAWESVLTSEASPGIFVWRGSPDRDLETEAETAGWGTLRVDTRAAGTMHDVYDALARDWSLPGWFGRNLDALWDSLSDLTVAPTVLLWWGASAFAAARPDDAVVLMGLWRDAVEQADALTVVLVDEPESSAFNELDVLL